MRTTFSIDAEQARQGAETAQALLRLISPGYFDALRMALVAGRDFNDADGPAAPAVVIIDDELARRHFPDRSPLGRTISLTSASMTGMMADSSETVAQIIGVVGTARPHVLQEDAVPTVYRPYAQAAAPFVNVLVRTESDPLAMVPALRVALAEIDPSQALHLPPTMTTLDQRIAGSLADRSLFGAVVGGFAALAALLAAIGIFSVVSYTVGRRTREIGVRKALGAHGGEIVAMVLRHGARVLAAGTILGMAGFLWLRRFLEAMLFGVATTDPLTLVATTAFVAVLVLVATYLPARRAARVSPVIALRTE
jgi:predicted permease